MEAEKIKKKKIQPAVLVIIAGLVVVCLVLGFLLFTNIKNGDGVITDKGYDTPEMTIEEFYQRISKGSYERALALFDANERTNNYELSAVMDYYQYYVPSQMPLNPKEDAFRVLNQSYFVGEAARELKFLVLAFMEFEGTDEQQISLNESISAEIYGGSNQLIQAMNPQSLSGLTLVRSDMIDEATQNSETYQANVAGLKKCYGCDDLKQYAALLELDGVFYSTNLTMAEYHGNWKIMSLSASLGAENGTSVLRETTEEDYQKELDSKAVQKDN